MPPMPPRPKHALARSFAAVASFLASLGLGSATSPVPLNAAEAAPAFRLLRLSNQIARWATPEGGGPATVTFAIAAAPIEHPGARNCSSMKAMSEALRPSGLSLDALRRELKAAFVLWESIVPLRFVETGDVERAGIIIGAQAVPRGRAFTNVTLTPESPFAERTIAQSMICLNPHQRWKIGFDGNLDVYDLRYTLAHEIGHAIGLDHPGPSGQLMSFRYTEAFRTPQDGDVSGARALYRRTPWSARSRAASGEGAAQQRSPAEGRASTLSLGAAN